MTMLNERLAWLHRLYVGSCHPTNIVVDAPRSPPYALLYFVLDLLYLFFYIYLTVYWIKK